MVLIGNVFYRLFHVISSYEEMEHIKTFHGRFILTCKSWIQLRERFIHLSCLYHWIIYFFIHYHPFDTGGQKFTNSTAKLILFKTIVMAIFKHEVLFTVFFFFFFFFFCRTHSHVLFWGHWYPCFGFLVTSPLGFKARVDSALFALRRRM